MTDPFDIDLLDTYQLLGLPAPRWLIDGILPEGDYSVLWGPSRQGKSFVALDWAVCLALGKPWQGRYAVLQNPVVYIAAEGGRGIQKRIRALMVHHQITDIPGLYYLIAPLYVREPGAVEAFLDELAARDIWPGLVVVDTLSRSFGGGEENASADMGAFIEAITQMAAGRSMTVLIIHHSNATGARERGSTALRCGANAMFGCKGDVTEKGHLKGLVLTNDKQKDEAEADEIYLRAEPCHGSLILQWEPMPERPKRGQGLRPPHVMSKQDMLTTLGNSEDGYTWKEWRLASQVPKHLFNRRLTQLVKDDEIYKEGSRYYVKATTHDLAAVEADDNEE